MPKKPEGGARLKRIRSDEETYPFYSREPRVLRLRLSRVVHELTIRSLVGHGPRVSQESIRAAALSAYLDAVEKRLGLPPLPLP